MCRSCGHQFVNLPRQSRSIHTLFKAYVLGKQTLHELSQQTGKSIRTLQRQFDHYDVEIKELVASDRPINLILDATFFTRSDGVLIFRANQKNLYWQFIPSETLIEISRGLDFLEEAGYYLQSVVIDGRRGVIKLIEACYPGLPIQLCQFHQAQIIRRYTTNRPETECGRELKQLMRCLTYVDEATFRILLKSLRDQYENFLKERNEQGQFKHRRLRSASRSLKTNLPYLFTYKKYPELNIPNTTNSCDGSFAHWKQKLKIHRGLTKERRNKLINYLLNSMNLS